MRNFRKKEGNYNPARIKTTLQNKQNKDTNKDFIYQSIKIINSEERKYNPSSNKEMTALAFPFLMGHMITDATTQ